MRLGSGALERKRRGIMGFEHLTAVEAGINQQRWESPPDLATSSSKAAASCKSAVSNPSVNQP